MDSAHPDIAWLRTLDATGRARFFAKLPHNLTISGRAVAIGGAPVEARLEQLRQLNEIQHRVIGYIMHALKPDEDLGWLTVVMNYVLKPADADLRNATARAWVETRNSFAAVT